MLKPLSRRTLLQALGGTGALSLMPLLSGSRAVAQSGDIPKRVVFVHFTDGMITGQWEPRPLEGASTYDGKNFALGPAMDPLKPYRSDMIHFENLEMVSTLTDPTPPGNAHTDGATHFLCAANRYDGNLPGGKSIDQEIADSLVANGVVTALKSAEIGFNPGGFGTQTCCSTGPGQILPAIGRPSDVYDRFFPAPVGGEDTAESSALLERNKRLYAFLRNEYGSFSKRLSSEDRAKLEQHAQLISELEQRKELLLSGDRRELWPDRSIITPGDALTWDYNADESKWNERWSVSADINMRLIAAALHSDVTRVVSMHMEPPVGLGFGYTLGDFETTDYHDLVHKVNDLANPHRYTQADNQDCKALLINEKHVLLNKLLILIDQLAQLKEVDGSRLLDHTVIVLTSHIANGSHELGNLPWFTLGNWDGYLKTGQLITLDRYTHPKDVNNSTGRGHADLFVALANGMGLEMDSFGVSSACNGPIVEMVA
jgi:Protein of unknown function (DUF1552)